MKSKHIDALISYRMERSRESIRAAEIMLENEMFAISMNRVYYSIANIQRLGWVYGNIIISGSLFLCSFVTQLYIRSMLIEGISTN